MIIDSTQTGTSGDITYVFGGSAWYAIEPRKWHHPITKPPEFTKRMLALLVLIAMFGLPTWGIYFLETLS